MSDAVYIGDGTLTAAKLRELKMRHALGQGPGSWLATVLAFLLGKQLPGAPPQNRDVTAFSRGLLSGLGYDPDTCQLDRRQRPFPGLVVRDSAGKPLQFVGEKALRKLTDDPLFMSGYAEEVEA